MSDTLNRALAEIIKQRTKIKEDFIRTYIAVNISDIELTPELFNNLVLCERYVGGEVKYWVQQKDKREADNKFRSRVVFEEGEGL